MTNDLDYAVEHLTEFADELSLRSDMIGNSIARIHGERLRLILAANRKMRAGLEDAAKALEHVDGALTAMADAMATPAHGTWEFVTKAARKARSALSTKED